METKQDGNRTKPIKKMSNVLIFIIFVIVSITICGLVNSKIDSDTDKNLQKILDACTSNQSSDTCIELKKKFNATVTCDDTSCNASIPVTHWYIFPVRSK